MHLYVVDPFTTNVYNNDELVLNPDVPCVTHLWLYIPNTILLAVIPSFPRIASDLPRTCFLIPGSASIANPSEIRGMS
jgi:hypothetical protein